MTYGLSITTPAATDPVALTEAKAHLRVDHSDEDTLITSLISAATQWAQNYTRRQFVTATFTMTLDGFPAGKAIELPRPPLVSVTTFTYTDTNGDSQTVAGSVYGERVDSVPGRLHLLSGQSWPATLVQDGVVSIVYVAGYGAASAVPESVKAAINLLVAHWYEHREEVIVGTITSRVQVAAESLLNAYRVAEVF